MNCKKTESKTDALDMLEYSAIALENVANLLQVLDELSSADIAKIDPKEPWTVKYFLERHKLSDSVLNATQIRVGSVLSEMNRTIEEIYRIRRAEKEVAKA